MTKLETSIETIDADRAALYLAGNSQNRPVNASRVKTYAQQMAEGRWQLTGEGIQLSTDGRLLDGQHRLMAIQRVCETDPAFAIPLLVVRGVPATAFGVIGQGKVRSLNDALRIEGHISVNSLAAIVVTHAQIINDDWNAQPGDNSRLLLYLKQHPLIEAVLPFIDSVKLIPNQTIMLAIMALALEQGVERDKLAVFAQGVKTGEALADGSPILALRNWAINQRLRKTPATKRDLAEQYAYILGAYLSGKQVKLLKIVARNDPFNFAVRSMSKPAA